MTVEEKHYKIREDLSIEFAGRKLYRIEALEDLPNHSVKKGDIGGFVESYDNLSAGAWIGGDAEVFGNAHVSGDARVFGDAAVYGDARVFEDAEVYGNASVCGHALVYGNAQVCGNAEVRDDAQVYEHALVYGDSQVCGNAQVGGSAVVDGNSLVSCGNIKKLGDVKNIIGEKYNITILPDRIQIGCRVHTRKEWRSFKDREILEMDGKEGLKWWKEWKPILMAICNTEE